MRVFAISLVVLYRLIGSKGGSSIPDLDTLWDVQDADNGDINKSRGIFLRDISIGRSLTKDVNGKHYYFLTYSQQYDW